MNEAAAFCLSGKRIEPLPRDSRLRTMAHRIQQSRLPQVEGVVLEVGRLDSGAQLTKNGVPLAETLISGTGRVTCHDFGHVLNVRLSLLFGQGFCRW